MRSEKNNLDADENVRVFYEFPNDPEESDASQSSQQNKKRPHNSKNMHFVKKSKSGESNKENTNKEKTQNNGQSSTSDISKIDDSNHDCKDVEINNGNNTESSSEDLENHRHIAKPVRRLFKENDNKRPTRIETDDKTNGFQRVTVADSTSEGALADVEDNADSRSNAVIVQTNAFKSVKATANTSEGALADVEDNADSQSDDGSQRNDNVSYDQEKNNHGRISNNTSTISTKLVTDQEGTSSSMLFAPLDKDPTLQNQTKTDNSTSGVSESNTSSQPAGGKGGEGPTSSATNQLKSNVGRLQKTKCLICNKKLGLTAFKCRCGGLYCSQHRYDKEHDCTFDYKTMGAEEIRKNNPQIIAEKISKL